MRSIAEQEGASPPEMLRHPVVHAVGREPVHLADPHFKMTDRPAADIFEFERLRVLGAVVSYSPDQPCAALAGQRKYSQEIGFVEVDMRQLWGMRTRSRSQRRAPAVGSVNGPSRERRGPGEKRRNRSFVG